MASPPTTDIDLCNGALLRLGQSTITTLTASTTNNAELLCFQHYPRVRDLTLAAFPWHEALVRTALTAYTEPAATLTPAATTGTNILFTASVASFVAGDVGKTLRGDTVPGIATITVFNTTSTVHADITQDFAATSAIPAGSWRLYNATPSWGEFPFTFVKPTGLLRVHRTEAKQRYAVEGTKILSSEDTLNLVYITQLTDTTQWSPSLTVAVETLLASTLAKPLTGSSATAKEFYDLWRGMLRDARGTAQLEGSPDRLGPFPLVAVRAGGFGSDPMTVF